MQKNPPVEWNREWALASEEFEDYPLGPHTKDELRTLTLESIIAKDERKLQRFYDPIREIIYRKKHRYGLKVRAESNKRYPRTGLPETA